VEIRAAPFVTPRLHLRGDGDEALGKKDVVARWTRHREALFGE
jgi:hypothetical protein